MLVIGRHLAVKAPHADAARWVRVIHLNFVARRAVLLVARHAVLLAKHGPRATGVTDGVEHRGQFALPFKRLRDACGHLAVVRKRLVYFL
jgi:hypothetical protein